MSSAPTLERNLMASTAWSEPTTPGMAPSGPAWGRIRGRPAAAGGEQAAQAGALARQHGHELPAEAGDARVDEGFLHRDADVVDEVLGREVVGAVQNHVVGREQVARVFRVEPVLVRDEAHVGIERAQAADRGIDLGPADVGRGVQDLALEVEISTRSESTRPRRPTRRRPGRRARANRARRSRRPARGPRAGVPARRAESRQVEVAGVALAFFGREQHGGSGGEERVRGDLAGGQRPQRDARIGQQDEHDQEQAEDVAPAPAAEEGAQLGEERHEIGRDERRAVERGAGAQQRQPRQQQRQADQRQDGSSAPRIVATR